MVVFIHEKMGYYLLNYVDDFIGAEYQSKVHSAHAALKNVLRDIGLKRSEKKSVDPTQTIEFVGNLVNTIDMTIGVIPTRKVEILFELEQWRSRSACTRRQLESLVGKLQFMSNCIRPGRLFVSRLLAEMKGMRRDRYYKISEEMRKDIKWWYLFIPSFEGTCILWLTDVMEVDSELAVDACLKGAGGVRQEEYYRVIFPQDMIRKHQYKITHLELWAVIIAVRIWGRELTGKIIRVKTDNIAVKHLVNSGRSQDLRLQKLLRELVWWLSKYQFKVKCVHLMGITNKMPDLLSRWAEGHQVQSEFIDRGGHKLKRRIVQNEWFQCTHEW